MSRKLKMSMSYKTILSVLIGIFIVLLPFEEALASSAGTILKLIGILISVMCITFLLKEDKVKFNVIHILVIMWIILGVISYFWCVSTYWWMYFIRTYISLVLMFIAITILPGKYYNLGWIKKASILASLIASLIIIMTPEASNFTNEGRRTIMLFGTTLDPNVVCAIIAIGVFSSLEFIFDKKIKKINKKYILFVFIMILGVLFTGSRGGLLSIGIVFIIWLLLNFKTSIPKKYVITILFALIITMIITVCIIPEELISTRFSFENLVGLNEIKSGAHSRYKIWSYVPELISLKPILGYGFGNFMSAMDTVYKASAAHNMYFLLIIESGIIGIAFFMSAIFITLRKLYIKRLYNDFCLFLVTLSTCFFLDGTFYKFFWIAWSIVIISLKKER